MWPFGPYLLRSVVSVNPTYVVLGTYQIFSTRGAKSSYIMGRGTFVARARCLGQHHMCGLPVSSTGAWRWLAPGSCRPSLRGMAGMT